MSFGIVHRHVQLDLRRRPDPPLDRAQVAAQTGTETKGTPRARRRPAARRGRRSPRPASGTIRTAATRGGSSFQDLALDPLHRQPRAPRRSGVRRRSRRGDRARARGGAAAVVCIGESIAAATRAAAIAARHPGFVFSTAGVHPHDAADFDPARDLDAIRAVDRRRRGRGRRVRSRLPLRPFAARPHSVARLRGAARAGARARSRPSSSTRAKPKTTRGQVIDGGRDARACRACCTATRARTRSPSTRSARRLVSSRSAASSPSRNGRTTTLLRLVPDDRLLVESDSPYLAPVPHRGKRNEPAWVSFTVARVAAARGVTPDDLGSRD